MPVKLNSAGGGSVTMDVGSTASNFTVTIPSATGTMALTSSVVSSLNGQSGAITNTDYGAIGSYVVAAEDTFTAGLERLPNVTVAGSSLIRSTYTGTSMAGLNNQTANFITNSAYTSLGLVGTWRRMTRSYNESDASVQSAVNLYVRIS